MYSDQESSESRKGKADRTFKKPFGSKKKNEKPGEKEEHEAEKKDADNFADHDKKESGPSIGKPHRIVTTAVPGHDGKGPVSLSHGDPMRSAAFASAHNRTKNHNQAKHPALGNFHGTFMKVLHSNFPIERHAELCQKVLNKWLGH